MAVKEKAPAEKQTHQRLVGLKAVGPKGWVVVYREVFPDGRVVETEETGLLNGALQMTSRLQRAIAMRLFHAKASKTWIRNQS